MRRTQLPHLGAAHTSDAVRAFGRACLRDDRFVRMEVIYEPMGGVESVWLVFQRASGTSDRS